MNIIKKKSGWSQAYVIHNTEKLVPTFDKESEIKLSVDRFKEFSDGTNSIVRYCDKN